MAIEIERRFLVRDPQAAIAGSTIANRFQIRQGYLGRVDGLRIRVRITADHSGQRTAILTLKSRRRGASRLEYELPFELNRAAEVLSALPLTHIICKTRYRLRYPEGVVWSIDRFEPPNDGLVIAEIELADPQQRIDPPPWVGEEVTFNPRYGNSTLARSPIRDCGGAVFRSGHLLPGDDCRQVTPI